MKKLGFILIGMMATIVFLLWNRAALRHDIAILEQLQGSLEQQATLTRVSDAEKEHEIQRLKERLDYAEVRLAAKNRDVPVNGVIPVSVSSELPRANLVTNSPNDFPTLPLTSISSSHLPTGELQHRSWGPEQLVGPPDTFAGGDLPTAWAPRDSTGTGEEWIHLNYDKSVELSQLRVRETYNAGAISKIAAVLPSGNEILLWQGTEQAVQAPVDTSFSLPPGVTANSVKIYMDRTRVPGWNEIDAVELIGRDGSRQWASSAQTSTSYAEPSSKSQGNDTLETFSQSR
jgi:hypothetical protein